MPSNSKRTKLQSREILAEGNPRVEISAPRGVSQTTMGLPHPGVDDEDDEKFSGEESGHHPQKRKSSSRREFSKGNIPKKPADFFESPQGVRESSLPRADSGELSLQLH